MLPSEYLIITAPISMHVFIARFANNLVVSNMYIYWNRNANGESFLDIQPLQNKIQMSISVLNVNIASNIGNLNAIYTIKND